MPEGGLETALFLDTQADFEYWVGLDFGAQMIWYIACFESSYVALCR